MAAATSGAVGSRYARLKAHYDLLSAHLGVGDSLLPNTSYANFLKEHEQQQLLPNVVPDSTSEVPAGGRTGRTARSRPLSANTIRQRAVKSLDESAKRLKAIEDLMWQHRQEERELKRTEMDIIRQKKQVNRTMKDYESKIAKQHVSETQSLLNREAQHVSYQHKDLHQKKEATKERTQTVLAGRQKVNEMTKKFMKTENELSWRYQTLLQSLERKKTEVEQLSQEFESKIRAKEEEQFHLKTELANLAIALNMEAQKRRHIEVDHDKQNSKAEKKDIQDTLAREDNLKVEERSKVMAGTRFENQRRELDKSLKTQQDTLKAKHRQGGRDLLDVRSRLQYNSENQRLVAREADHLQLEMMAQHTHTKMKVVEAKKLAQAEELQKRRQAQNAREKMEWERRFVTQENEARKREHEERLKQLSRLVTQYDHVEHKLFSEAKETEAQRKKQSQVVMKMQGELEHLKRENAKRLKEAAIEAQRAEMELQQKITRETGNLSKTANTHEETLQSLVKHRLRAKEERRMLTDEKKEHQRRARIENRTVLLSQTS